MQERFSPSGGRRSPHCLVVNASFAALSVNLKPVNESAADLFPVQFTLD